MELTQMMSSPADGEVLAEVLKHFSSNSVVWNWSSDIKYFLDTKNMRSFLNDMKPSQAINQILILNYCNIYNIDQFIINRIA